MYFVLSAVLLLHISSFGECASVDNTVSKSINNTESRIGLSVISVSNGQIWGAWGVPETCPPGTYATGFSLKVQPYQGFWSDDTALNGIALQCSKPISFTGQVGTYTTIRSSVGGWGSWTSNIWCPSGVLKAFQLRVEHAVVSDDTAANNIRFTCTGNQVLEGAGMSWGSWGSWSQICGGTGICGIQTRLLSPQGILDDTSLNDVTFFCCY